MPFDILENEMKVTCKIRYSAKPSSATIIPIGHEKVRVIFDEKQRAITKGQSVVFYDDENVIGGGIIDEII